MASWSHIFFFLTLLLALILPYVIAHDHIIQQTVPPHDQHTGQPHQHPPHEKKDRPKFEPGPWLDATATYYGGSDGGGTHDGACGYKQEHGYGLETAAVSNALFNDGAACGACYEIKCHNCPEGCKPGETSIIVTATNKCPPGSEGGWCDPPKCHFDLAQPAFDKIAKHEAGHVTVQYRRVPCNKQGGVRFTIKGNPYYNEVLVWNVAGAGDITDVQVKGENTDWMPMKRDWGQKWTSSVVLTNQSLSFRVTTSDGRRSTSWHIAPANWQFGQTYEGKNFR